MKNETISMLTDMAHEFQTPLAILKGNIEILARRGGPQEQYAARVAHATLDRLSRLVENLLAVAKLDCAQDDCRRAPVAIAGLLQETYEDAAILAEDKNIVLSVASENIFAIGERDKLKEVLLNLVSNALKYTPRGGSISITANMRLPASSGEGREDACGIAEIVVEDSGIGIAPENLPHIFERFYRIKDGSDAARGTGLGLHICQRIVEAHGGTIAAESLPGKGSRFIVRLLAEASQPAAERSHAIINSCPQPQ